MKQTHFWLLLGVLVLIALANPITTQPSSHAQDDALACDTLIQQAIAEVANICSGIGRNEACYGNGPVSAVLRDDSFFFEVPGDIIPVEHIETLITRPANPEQGEWGIVLMDIQADLPDSSDGAVRLLFYGGVTVNNQVAVNAPTSTCSLTNSSANNINIRSGPATSFSAVDILDQGASLSALGRNEDGSWLYTEQGWVAASVVEADCEIADLTVTTGVATVVTAPMQAFTVQMSDKATCQAAPAGLLIQSPKGETAKLVINNVELSVGSTAYISLRHDNHRLTISNLEGQVKVTAATTTRAVRPGNQTSIRFNDEGQASRPTPTQPIKGEALRLDFEILDEIIETDEFVDLLAICYVEELGDYDEDCLDNLFVDPYLICADPATGDIDEDCLDDYLSDPFDSCYDEDLGDYDEDCLDDLFDDPYEACYDPTTDTYDDDCIDEYDALYAECYDDATGEYDDDCIDDLFDDGFDDDDFDDDLDNDFDDDDDNDDFDNDDFNDDTDDDDDDDDF